MHLQQGESELQYIQDFFSFQYVYQQEREILIMFPIETQPLAPSHTYGFIEH